MTVGHDIWAQNNVSVGDLVGNSPFKRTARKDLMKGLVAEVQTG